MALVPVWTKQNKGILQDLEKHGRYVVQEAYVRRTNAEDTALFLGVYRWLARKVEERVPKPADVSYPVWVTLAGSSAMLCSPQEVVLRLEVEEELLVPVDINKWALILNYAYIPATEEDARRHSETLALYGVDDARAYMTAFYPDIKREIVQSWNRLFDEDIVVHNRLHDAVIWEIRREWVKDVIR